MDLFSPSILAFPSDVQRLFSAVVESRTFQRLKKISFLGAIDRFTLKSFEADFSSGSRFDHSIGVANITLAVVERMDLSPGELRIAVANALLHDIGHGPYSHSSEPFFSKAFGINHHKMLSKIIEDESSDVSRILKSFGLWLDYRRFVRAPNSIPAVEHLFYGPINVDTIEGIIRSAKFFRIETELDTATLAQAISRSHIPMRPLDSFWNLKSAVYNEYIFDGQYACYDDVLTQSLFSISDRLRPKHFGLDDSHFEEEVGLTLQRSVCDEQNKITVRSASRTRTFRINRNVMLNKFHTLEGRYSEVRGDEWKSKKILSRKAEGSRSRK